ncbi:hypothetical protein LAWI1_G000414 [Lachnellula willkommii]|uniref:Uncharacterized protein n=1 Tax=Lachnellula willkommii TaxID=215461 RepID=A0A559MKP8_9HELO|nr:hypothetical protein LAWI1_G000414 [Lachnellula willkommii]
MADAPDSPIQTSSQQFHSPQHSQGSRANGAEKSSGAPGSTWNTKKFNEEYDRAMMGILDKDWDHTKYGDVLMS